MRRIKVYYYRLVPTSQGDLYREQSLAIKAFLNAMDQQGWPPLQKGNDSIVFNHIYRNPGFLYGSMSRIQTSNIPSKRNPNSAQSTPIEFSSPQEGLEHATCFVFDLATNIVGFENLQQGVSVDDFLLFVQSNVGFQVIKEIVIANNVQDFLNNLNDVSLLNIKVAGINSSQAFTNVEASSLSEILALSNRTNGYNIEVVISKERGNEQTMNLDIVKGMVSGIMSVFSKRPETVKKAVVKGRSDFEEGNTLKEIDLVQNKLMDILSVPNERSITAESIMNRVTSLSALYLIKRPGLVELYGIQ